MKKVLLSIAAIATNFAMAQSIPNGGFENWTTQSCLNPQYYNSSNLQQNGGSSGIGPVNVVQTTDAYHGTYAVKMTTTLAGVDTQAAYLLNWNPNSGGGSPQGGIPYNQQPTGMRLYYKCNVMAGDTALIMLFFKVGGTIFSQTIQKITGTQSTYTLLTVPLTLSLTPDSLMFAAVSSNKTSGNFKGIPGSMLQIDSVTFTGVSSQPTDMNGDFETWQTYSVTTLQNWSISGSRINNQTTDKFAGTYALELKTNSTNQAGDSTYSSEATTGRSTNNSTVGGYPYSSATDTLFFHYKYAPANANDSAFVMLQFKKAGVFTGGVMKLLKASASYLPVAIGFSVSPTPDSVIVFIHSSKKFSPLPISYLGADLKIDNMYFKSQATPVTSFSLPASGCINQAVQLTDMSSNIPITWTWTATNGTLSNANAQTPMVTYTTNGTYTVTLNTSNTSGSGTLISQTITINGTPTVSISAVSDTICSGATATLTASGASTYSWNTSETTTSIIPSPTVTTIYTVTGTDVNACMNTATHTITIDIPTVKIDGTSAGSATLCAGTVLTATASGANTYTWSPGNSHGTTLTGTLTTSVTFTLAGTDVKGCTNVATFSLHINPKPAVTVNSATICAGSTATLTAAGAVTYTWIPFGFTTTGTTIFPSPAATIVYTVTGKDGNNCKNTATSTVTVNATPTVTVNSSTICIGATTTLTASGTATTYSWSTNEITADITPSPTVTTNYTVTGTDLNSCTNTATSTVNINPLPSFTFTATSTICEGSIATITASGASTYTWSTSETTASISPSPTVTTNYTVTGTDVNTCTNTASITITVIALPTLTLTASTSTICAGATTTLTASGATTYSWSTSETTAAISPSPTVTANYTVTGDDGGCTNTASITITVNATPTVSVNSSTICAGSTATLTVSGASTYSWNTSETTASISPSPTVTTNYTVTGTDVNACMNTATSTVTVNDLPIITITPSSATVCAGTPDVLTASPSSNTYTWANTSETTASISASPTVTTNYTVTGTDASGCINSDTLSIIVNSCSTGIEQFVNGNVQVSIYPNPSNGTFVIETTAITKQTMQVYDVNGKLVLNQNINGKTAIDANSLNEGVYNISIISNEGVVNKRLVIVK